MAKNPFKKRNFKSLDDLDSHKSLLKAKRNSLKQEIVQDIFNPVNIVMSVSKNIIGKLGGKKKALLASNESTISINNKNNKTNLSKVLSAVLDIKSLNLLALLKFFFRKIGKTSWFKWQLIFILYSIVRGILIRRKKSKQAA